MTTADELVAAATDRAGLTDFGGDSWRPGLEILVRSLDEDPGVIADGRTRLHEEFVAALWNRLRVVDHVKRHPDIADQPIERPLVILGMPRTGTTLASYLLDRDSSRRSLLNWEAAESIPPPTTSTLRTDDRCVSKLAWQRELFDAITAAGIVVPHWEWADGPTECIFVQNQDFKAFYWDAMMLSAEYSDWMLECDMTSAYAYEKLVLQVLQSQAPGRWSLKMPSHAVHIETLLSTFPDARMVWAHRDPVAVIRSHCNALHMGKSTMFTEIDKQAIGRTSLKQLRAHVDRATVARDRIGEEHFFDLRYSELVADPLDVMRRLYEWDGQEFTPEIEAGMRQYVADDTQGSHGRHTHSLKEFGLSVEEIEHHFSRYAARFGIELGDD